MSLIHGSTVSIEVVELIFYLTIITPLPPTKNCYKKIQSSLVINTVVVYAIGISLTEEGSVVTIF